MTAVPDNRNCPRQGGLDPNVPVRTPVDHAAGAPISQGLVERHIADLRRSGLSEDTIAAAGFMSLTPAQAHDTMGMAVGSGYLIPYPGTPHVRFRLDDPRPASNGTMRYATRKGDTPRLYVPPTMPTEWAADPGIEIDITEGEKKSLAATQNGRPTLAVAGVWCWLANGKPLPDFDEIVWECRRVNIIGDSDLAENPQAKKGFRKLAHELARRGAEVRVLILPADGDAKVGLDDFLLSHTVDDLAALLAKRRAVKARAPAAATTHACAYVSDHHRTDSGNAELFDRLFGKRVRYVYEERGPGEFLIYTDKEGRWVPDLTGHAERLALEVARERLRRAAAIDNEQAREAEARWALRSESAAKRRDLLIAARSREGLVATRGSFDTQRYLLNTLGGVIDLRNGDVLPHDPALMLTKLSPVAYDPHAAAPRFEQFISEIFDGDEERMGFVQRAAGYSLTADVSEQCLMLNIGGGRNGKGVLLNTLLAAAGDYGYAADFSLFSYRRERDAATRNDIASLRGYRLVTAVEPSEGLRLSEATLKHLTGGDRINARLLYREAEPFTPTFHIWLAANFKPTVRDNSSAFWSRIRLIDFPVSFLGREDRRLEDKLRAELPGILRWLVEGAVVWYGNATLDPPDSVLESTDDYRRDQDWFGSFVEDCLIDAPGGSCDAKSVYARFREWAEDSGWNPRQTPTQQAFGRRMTERGYRRRRTATGYVYDDVGTQAGR